MIYFNEIDLFEVQWLRNLYPQAVVDERSITQVQATDLVQYQRCHFFAGIAGWEYALHLAGWPTDREVWTGSCPCQPFSIAGRQQGASDKRHLWPEFRRLIRECRPATVFGEQVASELGRAWVAGVRADLEELGYAVGVADLCAAGVGAPHVRQRLYWVANTRIPDVPRFVNSGRGVCGKQDTPRPEFRNRGMVAWVPLLPDSIPSESGDGFRRPVGEMRAYGNAIVPQLASVFVRSFMEAVG